jgi:hypothetical protein
MKTLNKIRYVQGVLCAMMAVMTLSCLQPNWVMPEGGPAGKGTVVLTASTGSPASAGSALRTILPTGLPDFSRYVLTFSRDGYTSITVDSDKEDILGELTGGGHEVKLDAGGWQVTVEAYRPRPDATGDYLAGTGNKPVLVKPGAVEDVDVEIEPLLQGDGGPKGTFAYRVRFPDEVRASVSLKDDEGDEILGNGDGLSEDESIEDDEGNPIEIQLDPGYYRLSISLTKENGTSAGVWEIVHIYAGFKTEADHKFEEGDFSETVYLAGTFSGLPAGFDPQKVDIKVYYYIDEDEDEYQEVQTVDVGAPADKWIVGIPVDNLEDIIGQKTLYVEARYETTDGKVYVVTGNTGGPLTEAGKFFDEPLSDSIPPGKVDNLSVVIEKSVETEPAEATIEWDNPGDEDFDHIEIQWSWYKDKKQEYHKVEPITDGSETYTVKDFDFAIGMGYTFTVTAVDTARNKTPETFTASLPYTGENSAADLEEAIQDAIDGDSELNLEDLIFGSAVTLDLKTAKVRITGTGSKVPDNMTLKIGGELIVDEGGKLTVNGRLNVVKGGKLEVAGDLTVATVTDGVVETAGLNIEGKLNITGTLTVPADGEIKIADGGNITVQDGGKLYLNENGSTTIGTNDGTITIEKGGASYDLKSGGGSLGSSSPTSNQKNVVKAGGKVYIGGTSDDTNLRIGSTTDNKAIIQLKDGEFIGTPGNYTLAGNATIRGGYGLNQKILTVKTGKTLTIELTHGGDLGADTYGVFLSSDSPGDTRIVGEGSAKIDVKTPTDESFYDGLIHIGGSASANFYDSDGALVPAVEEGNTIIGTGVYKWNTKAGGDSTPGWKAEDLTAKYPLVALEDAIGQPYLLDSKAEDKNGIVTITLSSKTGTALTGTEDFGADNEFWGQKEAGAPDGLWADLTIDMSDVFSGYTDEKVYAIRSESQAYRYYTGGGGILEAEPTAPANGYNNIYIDETDTKKVPVRWKEYSPETFKDDKTLSLLLWAGANPKTIKLEIADYTDEENPSPVKTLVIDYKGVKIE